MTTTTLSTNFSRRPELEHQETTPTARRQVPLCRRVDCYIFLTFLFNILCYLGGCCCCLCYILFSLLFRFCHLVIMLWHCLLLRAENRRLWLATVWELDYKLHGPKKKIFFVLHTISGFIFEYWSNKRFFCFDFPSVSVILARLAQLSIFLWLIGVLMDVILMFPPDACPRKEGFPGLSFSFLPPYNIW